VRQRYRLLLLATLKARLALVVSTAQSSLSELEIKHFVLFFYQIICVSRNGRPYDGRFTTTRLPPALSLPKLRTFMQ
jgi:hypothetical protein